MSFSHTTITMMLLTVFLVLSCCNANLIRPAPGTPPVHKVVTSTKMPEPTSPATRKSIGFINEDVLFPRQAVEPETCGYREGNPARPLTCATGLNCYWTYTTGTSWGPACCSEYNGVWATDCTEAIATTCFDYGSAISSYLPETATLYDRQIFW